MGTLKKLTIQNLKLNKKRTIVTIIGIMLSVALLVTVSSMYAIVLNSAIKYLAKESRDYHVAFYELSKEDFNIIKQNRAVDKIDITKYIGCAKTDTTNPSKTYAYIQGCTKNTLKKFVKLSNGRLPQNDSEILIDHSVDKIGNTKVKLGTKITLNIGEKADINGKLINKDNPSNITDDIKKDDTKLKEFLKNEQIINSQEKTYTIVGIMKAPFHFGDKSQQVVGNEFLTYIDDSYVNDSNTSAIVKLKSHDVKNWAKITGAIINVDDKLLSKYFSSSAHINIKTREDKLKSAKYNISVNRPKILLESSNSFELLFKDQSFIFVLFLITMIAIIVVTSIFCIRNSFDISISEKIKQYSMLKSIGATKKQIRKNVFFEAKVLGLIGIPLGIVTGLLLPFILTKIYNTYKFATEYKLEFEFSGVAIIMSVILAIITIFLSAYKSAKKAAKFTIIEGIKNSSNIKIKYKNFKTPTLITKIFGIGGALSYKNLKRNKKKYKTTTISIVLSIIVTIALSSVTSIIFKTITIDSQKQDYNVSVSSYSYDEDIYNKFVNTTKSDYIKNYTILKRTNFNTNDIKVDFVYNANIFTINNEQYKKYIGELGLDYNNVKDKAIFVNTITHNYFYDKSTGKLQEKKASFDLKNDKKVTGKISKDDNKSVKNLNDIKNGKDFSLDIACITDKRPFSMTSNEEIYKAFFIVSDEFYENNLKEFTPNVQIRFDSSNPDKLEKELKDLLQDERIDLVNIKSEISHQQNQITFITFFLYSFTTIIILIGLTSVFNTIATSVELRKPEFAMLKSIGMTKKEFNKMIGLETLFMGTKSLLIGLPLGIGLSYFLYLLLFSSDEGMPPYKLPIVTIIIVILSVFILISIIMKYSLSKTNKQNIIETIRNENI